MVSTKQNFSIGILGVPGAIKIVDVIYCVENHIRLFTQSCPCYT